MVTRKIGPKATSQWQLHLHFWVKRKCPVTACSAISACGKAQHWEKSLEIYQIWERENQKQLSKPASLGRQEMQFTNFNALTHTHFFVMHYTYAQYAQSSHSLMLSSFMERYRLLMDCHRKVSLLKQRCPSWEWTQMAVCKTASKGFSWPSTVECNVSSFRQCCSLVIGFEALRGFACGASRLECSFLVRESFHVKCQRNEWGKIVVNHCIFE